MRHRPASSPGSMPLQDFSSQGFALLAVLLTILFTVLLAVYHGRIFLVNAVAAVLGPLIG